jgi:AP2 domain
LNNRRSNLRAATVEQNGGNRRKDERTKGSSSLYKGVSLRPYNTFEAQIRANGKLIYLGKFKSEVEAAIAYDAAARKHFGPFAAVNFPQQENNQEFAVSTIRRKAKSHDQQHSWLGLMAIQKNTSVSETVLKVSGGYRFHVLNECNAPEEIRHFEKPGIVAINCQA